MDVEREEPQHAISNAAGRAKHRQCQPHSAAIGAATMPSSRRKRRGPVCSTTPPTNLEPSWPRSQRSWLASPLSTAAAALTSMAATRSALYSTRTSTSRSRTWCRRGRLSENSASARNWATTKVSMQRPRRPVSASTAAASAFSRAAHKPGSATNRFDIFVSRLSLFENQAGKESSATTIAHSSLPLCASFTTTFAHDAIPLLRRRSLL